MFGKRKSRIGIPILLALLIAGGAAVWVGSRHSSPPPAPLPVSTYSYTPSETQALARADGTRPGTTPPSGGGLQSCRSGPSQSALVIPSLCIFGPVTPVGTDHSGALQIPTDVHVIGVWAGGAPLYDNLGLVEGHGTTLLAGHVDFVGQGNGALYPLARAQAGQRIYLSDARGRVTTWLISSREIVRKAALPGWLFAQATGPRRLAIVTCGGPLVYVPGYGNSYEDNVIVQAIPA